MAITNEEKHVIEKYINDGDVVFDIGAHTGEWSKVILEKYRNVQLHAFEPSQENYGKLVAYLEPYLEHGQITLNELAISNEQGQKTFYYYNHAPSWSTFYRRYKVESQFKLDIPSTHEVRTCSLDIYCRQHNIRHIHYLKIDTEGAEFEVVRGAKELLSEGRVDYLQFEYGGTFQDSGTTLREVYDFLRSMRYELFKMNKDGLQHIDEFHSTYEDYQYCNFFVANERFKSTLLGHSRAMLDLEKLFAKNNITPKGVIHIGAHEGKEAARYKAMGVKKVLFIEANPEVYNRLVQNTKSIENIICVNCAIADFNGQTTLHITSMDESSSILPLKQHLQIYPSIQEVKQLAVPCRTLDTLLEEIKISPSEFNVINIDIQGAELLAFRGAARTLPHIDAINTEINYEELYQGCALVDTIDEFLGQNGFARKATTCPWHRSWGDGFYVKTTPVSNGTAVITMTSLGRNGRFANQLFQYAFLKLYAEQHHLQLETPSWIGQSLFGFNDPPIRKILPELKEATNDIHSAIIPNSKKVYNNVDFWGYFQYHTSFYSAFKKQFRQLFKPIPEIEEKMNGLEKKLRMKGNTIVGLHLRRGDYGYEYFFVSPTKWYIDWLEQIWPELNNPVLYIASDEPEKVVDDFAKFNPVTAADLDADLPISPCYPDFYLLTKCDYAAISNSSFSFLACMLNEKGKKFYRPRLSSEQLIPFDPWNSEVLFRDEKVEMISTSEKGHQDNCFKEINVFGQKTDSPREGILLQQAVSNRPMKQEQEAKILDSNSSREKLVLNSAGPRAEAKRGINGANSNGEKYRILLINTDYDHFLQKFYGTNPELYTASFSEQYSGRSQTLFGVNDFYSSNLRNMGHPAVDLFYNNRFMQYAWAVENGFMARIEPNSIPYLTEEWLAAVFQTQVRTFKPDVIINFAMEAITSRILNSVKADVPLIIGQHAAPITNTMQDLSAYDLLISSLPNYVEHFRQKNKQSRYLKLCFEPSILKSVPCSDDRPIDIAFVGGFSSNHLDGVNLFNYLAEQNFSMYLCGYGQEALSPKAAKFYKGSAYGKEMYEIYSKSKIVINRHIDISDEYANNLRLYEATGMGSLLVTDLKKNLNSLFDTDNEVVTYTSKEQCAERIRYYLENADERKRISQNGQKRTVSEHNYQNRMSELVETVNEFLQGRKNTQTQVNHQPKKAVSDITEITVAPSFESFSKLKQIASQKRFGEWCVKFNGLTIYCHDILSFYMAAKDIFLHRIYDFNAQTDEPVIIDGGGHIGLFTLFIKQKYPKARVTVFEPDKESLVLLRRNLEANGFNSVDIVEAGLYKQDGTISFGSDHSDGSSIFAKDKNNTINVARLSKYIESEIDILKLNIEGAELDVITEIQGKLPLIKNIVIEYHGFPEIGQNLHKLLEILSLGGFRYMIHDFDSETNPATKPPVKLERDTRFFLLIYAGRIMAAVKPESAEENRERQNMSLQPVSRTFGFDRGTPIDRYYIEKFMKANSSFICGHVMEIADNSYTRKFGTNVIQSDILNSVPCESATIVGDLATGENIPENTFDCIILTQTIQMIYDVKAALRNAVKALKPGGTLLISASGISQISRFDMDRWGEYWRFTDKSLKMLLAEISPEDEIHVETYGNVAVAKAFIDGLAVEELGVEVLDYQDDDYQVLLTARVHKPVNTVNKITHNSTHRKSEPALKTPLVLLYHRVADDPIDSQLLAVSPKNFEEHLKELTQNYRILPLAELLHEIRKGQLNADTVAVTFDDGYLDNLTNAVPLLEKYNVPATIFVTSGMVNGDREFWWDELERIFLTEHRPPSRLTINDSQGALDWDLTTPQNCIKAYDELCSILRNKSVANINQIVDQLLVWAKLRLVSRDTHLVVNSEQLARLSKSPMIEIGSHTASHSRLSILKAQEQLYEILLSKRQLEFAIRKPVRLLSYPYGGTDDFTSETKKNVAEQGYEAGIANIQGNITAPVDMYAIPRRLVRNWTGHTFAQWLGEKDKRTLEMQTLASRGQKISNYLLQHKIAQSVKGLVESIK